MKPNENQIELLMAIQRRLKYGDIKAIAEVVDFSREYVGKVLSPTSTEFHEDIVSAAVEIIAAREQNTKNLLQKITA